MLLKCDLFSPAPVVLVFLVAASLLADGAPESGRLPECIISCEGQTHCLKKCLDEPGLKSNKSGHADGDSKDNAVSTVFAQISTATARSVAGSLRHTIGVMGPAGPRLCSDVSKQLKGKTLHLLLEVDASWAPGEVMPSPPVAVDAMVLGENMNEMILRDGSLDILLSAGNIEHSTNGPGPTFSAMARWLGQGGTLVVATGPMFGGEPTIASYKPEGLRKALAEAGFTNVRPVRLEGVHDSLVFLAKKGEAAAPDRSSAQVQGVADLLDGVVSSQGGTQILRDANGHTVAVAIGCESALGPYGNTSSPMAWSSRAGDLMRHAKLPQYFLYDNDDLRNMVVAEWSSGTTHTRKRRVLDVGCGSGVLLSRLKHEVPGLTTECIELVPWAAEAARARGVDVVYQGAVEDVVHRMPRRSYDAVIFSDSLEHMVDPWAVLRGVRPLLREGNSPGAVYACIPNIMYGDVIKELLKGHFTYVERGILDRTHLRWFTRKSLTMMFEVSGYVVTRMGSRGPSESTIPTGLRKSIANQIEGINENEFAKDTSVFQYFVVAHPTHQRQM